MAPGMSIAAFTLLHVIICLIAIGSGLIVVGGMFASHWLPGMTALFLFTTVLTGVTLVAMVKLLWSHLLAFRGQGAAQLLRQFAHVFTERAYHGRRVLARDLDRLSRQPVADIPVPHRCLDLDYNLVMKVRILADRAAGSPGR